MIWPSNGSQQTGSLHAIDVKICDLCGALNLESNGECFICRWRGHFETRPDVVQMALEVAERQMGKLDTSAVTGSFTYYEGEGGGILAWLRRAFRGVHVWLFG